MVLFSNIGYESGRGKPVYLLDRTKYEPSIGSDYGVSKLFDRSPSIGTLSSLNTSHASSIYGGSAETRTTRSENLSSLTEKCSMDNVPQRTYEMSKFLSRSFINTSSDLPVCLKKDEDYIMHDIQYDRLIRKRVYVEI